MSPAGGLAKLRLARREGRALIYAGCVGTGWDHKTARAVRGALAPLARLGRSPALTTCIPFIIKSNSLNAFFAFSVGSGFSS